MSLYIDLAAESLDQEPLARSGRYHARRLLGALDLDHGPEYRAYVKREMLDHAGRWLGRSLADGRSYAVRVHPIAERRVRPWGWDVGLQLDLMADALLLDVQEAAVGDVLAPSALHPPGDLRRVWLPFRDGPDRVYERVPEGWRRTD